jgi:hypothetical protein
MFRSIQIVTVEGAGKQALMARVAMETWTRSLQQYKAKFEATGTHIACDSQRRDDVHNKEISTFESHIYPV